MKKSTKLHGGRTNALWQVDMGRCYHRDRLCSGGPSLDNRDSEGILVMIESTRHNGNEKALCTCDTCHKEKVLIGARHGAGRKPAIKNMETVYAQLRKSGWSVNGKVITCIPCAKKLLEDKPVQKEELRQPSKKQKRDIIGLLEDVYDTENERYRGVETDKSVADTLGDGILWGWVAQIRDELFGPDGNEHNLIAAEEVHQWIESSQQVIAEFNQRAKEYAQMLKELEVIKTQGETLVAKIKGVK